MSSSLLFATLNAAVVSLVFPACFAALLVAGNISRRIIEETGVAHILFAGLSIGIVVAHALLAICGASGLVFMAGLRLAGARGAAPIAARASGCASAVAVVQLVACFGLGTLGVTIGFAGPELARLIAGLFGVLSPLLLGRVFFAGARQLELSRVRSALVATAPTLICAAPVLWWASRQLRAIPWA